MLHNCFINFVVEHWVGLGSTEAGCTRDIGPMAIWLIDKQSLFFLWNYSMVHKIFKGLLEFGINTFYVIRKSSRRWLVCRWTCDMSNGECRPVHAPWYLWASWAVDIPKWHLPVLTPAWNSVSPYPNNLISLIIERGARLLSVCSLNEIHGSIKIHYLVACPMPLILLFRYNESTASNKEETHQRQTNHFPLGQICRITASIFYFIM